MGKLTLIALGVAVVAVAVGALLFSPVSEHWRTESPDGRFSAVVRTRPFDALIPAMPGGGSDKSGRITLYRDGQSCGAAALPMVQMAYALAWRLDASPRRAEVPLVARWNLDACRIE